MTRRIRSSFVLVGMMAFALASIRHDAAVRCLAAFALRGRKQRPTFAASSTIDNSNKRFYQQLIQRPRGGSSDPHDRLHASTSATEASKAVPEADNRNISRVPTSASTSLSQIAAQSMSIAGKSSTLKSFDGLTFRDALAEGEKFRVIFVLGGPGAGKGTQCELLKQNYPCVHLSAGQLLREEAEKGDASEHAALIEECLVAGKIVPVEISLALLQNAMRGAEGKSILFLVDGFPRNFDNLEGWTRCMAQGEDASAVWGTLVYHCPLATLEKRVMERSKDSGRSDDNLESLRRRFATFQGETVPVINTLRAIEEDTLLKVVDIKGEQSLEKVWEDTQKTMNCFLTNDILSANVRLLEAVANNDAATYRSLCADEMFDIDGGLTAADIMLAQEGSDHSFTQINVRGAVLTFVTGTKVSLSYDRSTDSGISFRETRIWSHQGSKGWRTVHFSRSTSCC